MKIALIRQKYHKYGGAEKIMAMLAEGLAEKGWQITVFTRKYDSPDLYGIDFRKISVPSKPPFLRTLCFALSVKKQIERNGFDIVHSFERSFYQDIYRTSDGCYKEWMRKLIKMSPNPVEKLLMSVKLSNKIALYLEKKTFKKGHYKKIIAISKRVKEEIMRYYDVPSHDIEVVYNGVDLEKFNPENKNLLREKMRKELNLKKDDFIILFIGSGFKRKGLKSLIQAISELSNRKNCKLLIVGKGKKSYYLSVARKLNVADKLIFTGRVVNPEGFYAVSDVMVLPSFYEPFGNVCLEALASGVPVIVSKECGASEIISENVNGLIIHNNLDYREITRKIELAFDGEFREKLIVNSRLLAEKYSKEKYIERMIDIYKKVREPRSNP